MRAGGAARTQQSTEPLDPRYHMVDLTPEGADDCWDLAGIRGWAGRCRYVGASIKVATSCAQPQVSAQQVQDLLARAESRPLRVKLGVDPSGSDLTLGHAVVLRKLRQFQDYGHIAILIVGDFTGQVGDPTGRSQTRRILTQKQTRANARTYLSQALKILREDRLELHYNSTWLGNTNLADVLRISRSLTVARLLERDDFGRRYRENLPVTLMEFMYPMLQGMDSVAIQSDVELGGTDQTYNNLVGRALQKDAAQDPQLVLTVPLLRGTDGAEKMGKSLGNWISLNDTPDDQFGKIMSISDDLLTHYAELCCGWDADRLAGFAGAAETKPMEGKLTIAHRIVELYHGRVVPRPSRSGCGQAALRRTIPAPPAPCRPARVPCGRVWRRDQHRRCPARCRTRNVKERSPAPARVARDPPGRATAPSRAGAVQARGPAWQGPAAREGPRTTPHGRRPTA